MVIINNVNDLIKRFKNFEDLEHVKAGKWQGIDSLSNHDILVLRDVNQIFNLNNLSWEDILELFKPDLTWCDIHFSERVSGKPLNPGESYKFWPYNKFKEDGTDEFLLEGKFDHTYMERFWPKKASEDALSMFARIDKLEYNKQGIRFEYGDLDDLISLLKSNPLTRQAYLPIWFPEDTWASNNSKRVPCTLGYLFEIYNNTLNITYYIRSCDIFRHYRNDMYLTYRLLEYIRVILLKNKGFENLELGKMSIKIANLHLFRNDHYPFIKKENNLWKG
jgi:hypothetical protein